MVHVGHLSIAQSYIYLCTDYYCARLVNHCIKPGGLGPRSHAISSVFGGYDVRSSSAGAAAFLALALLALTPVDAASAQTGGKLVVFAAASLATALKVITPIFIKEKGQETVISYGSSGVLAKQIEQGAPADVFISADTKWVDYLQKKNLLAPHSRRDLLGNHLRPDRAGRWQDEARHQAWLSISPSSWATARSPFAPSPRARPGSMRRRLSPSLASGARSNPRWRRRTTCATPWRLSPRGRQ